MKNSDISNMILELLENGSVSAGDKLEGALKLAEKIGCAAPRVQTVVETLAKCGILETRHRSGTYVRSGWQDMILPENFLVKVPNALFMDGLAKRMNLVLPELRLCRKFSRGNIELAVTHKVLSHQDEYADVADIFEECFLSESCFFHNVIQAFYVNGKLCGVPFAFSPQVVFYNDEFFEKAGIPEPAPNWDFDAFFRTVEILSGKFPGKVMFPEPRVDDWINFVIRSSGKLMDPQLADPVRIDAAECRKGIKRYASLLRKMQGGTSCQTAARRENAADHAFANGELALLFGFRQTLFRMRLINPELRVKCIPLPQMSGCPANVQGADLIVFRRDLSDRKLIRDVLKFFLSEEMQIFAGKVHGGIPFIRKAAEITLNPADPLDAVFLSEIPLVSTDYNIFSEHIFNLVTNGIARICSMPPERIDLEINRLAEAVRTVRDVENFSKKHP